MPSFSASGVVTISSMVVGKLLESSWYTFPARRIGYDVDGTRVFLVASERLDPDNKATLHQLSQAAVEGLNGDYSSGLSIKGRRYYYGGEDANGNDIVLIEPGFWGEATYSGQNNYIVLFFAEPQRLRAWYSRMSVSWQEDHTWEVNRDGTTTYPMVTLEASPDSTNGQDGTWYQLDHREPNLVTFSPDPSRNATLTTSVKNMDGEWLKSVENWQDNYYYSPSLLYWNPYREEFLDGRLNDRGWYPLYGGFTRNVVALRLAVSASGPYPSLSSALALLHLYGEPDQGAGEVRLAVVDPNTDVELKMDPSWGNVDVGSTTVISVGIRNLSTTLTATEVTASIASSWPDGAPSTIRGIVPPSQYTSDVPWLVSPLKGFLHLSLDGDTWAEEISLGDLAPLQTVRVYARQMPVTSMEMPPFPITVPNLGVVGMRFARIQAETEGWV